MKSDFSWLEQPVIVPLVKDITLNYLTSLQGLSYEVKSQNVPTNCLTGRCLYCWGSQGISFSVEENKQRVCRCLFATNWRLLRFFVGGKPMVRLGRERILEANQAERTTFCSILGAPTSRKIFESFTSWQIGTEKEMGLISMVAFASAKQKTYQLNSMTTTSKHALTNTKLSVFASTEKRIRTAGHKLSGT